MSKPHRNLLLASWKVKRFSTLDRALLPGTIGRQYPSDATAASVLQLVKEELANFVVDKIGLIGHGQPGTLCLFQSDKSHGSYANDQDAIIELLKSISEVCQFSNDDSGANRLDLLLCPLAQTNDGIQLFHQIHDDVGMPMTLSRDVTGEDLAVPTDASVSSTYFATDMLRGWTNSGSQSISSFEKIRTIGKGAYGTAVLYRKKDDDFLVVLKEINIHDLNASERQLAKNEVKVLSMLSHPNIIGYLDSFEEDGTLWIEMEYADGGTLGQHLTKHEKPPDEKDILVMFTQMVSALKYIHEHSILHRDLKTENIFLTQEKKVKLGDFGIAKVMSTCHDANTVLGTPYYISPEMCQGKPYNEKSDIWALGCILYEMANLQKTFEGTNLPALVTKIVKGAYTPIKESFSVEFRTLVRDMLEKDPASRPTAQELLLYRLPELLSKYDESNEDNDALAKLGKGPRRSLLYFVDLMTDSFYPVHGLPPKIIIAEVAVGLSHVVVVGREHGVFAWGDNAHGQLGLGDSLAREQPCEIGMLRSKAVIRASCGDRFSAFLSDNGLVLTCGDGTSGCLGHNDWMSISRPKLVDDLLTVDVVTLNCGPRHIGVTTALGGAYTWGVGEDGRLGIGSEESKCSPTEVKFAESLFVRDIKCGFDGTMFIMDTGAVFATGKNDYNKLGLNPRQGFLYQLKINRSSKVESIKEPRYVKELCKYQIDDVHLGSMHSLVVTGSRKLLTIGANSSGQLGAGTLKSREIFASIKGIDEESISVVSLGENFCLAGTQTNTIFFWGTKPTYRVRSVSADMSTRFRSFSSAGESSLGRMRVSQPSSSREDLSNSIGKTGDEDDSVFLSMSVDDSTTSALKSRRARDEAKLECEVPGGRLDATNSSRAYLCLMYRRQFEPKKELGVLKMSQDSKQRVETLPYALFNLDTITGGEGDACDDDTSMMLRGIRCYADNAFVLVDTSAPPPKRKKRQPSKESTKSGRSSMNNSKVSKSSISGIGLEEPNSSEASELDATADAPTWLRKELKHGIPVQEAENSGDADDSDLEEESSSKGLDSLSLSHNEHRLSVPERRDSDASLDTGRAFRIIQRIQKKESLISMVNENASGTDRRKIDAAEKNMQEVSTETSNGSTQGDESIKRKPTRTNNQQKRTDIKGVTMVNRHDVASDDDPVAHDDNDNIDRRLSPVTITDAVRSRSDARVAAKSTTDDRGAHHEVNRRTESSNKRNSPYSSKGVDRKSDTKVKSKSSRRKSRTHERERDGSHGMNQERPLALRGNSAAACDEGIGSDSSALGRSREEELQMEINRLMQEKRQAEAMMTEDYQRQLSDVEKRNEQIRTEAEERERELKHEITHLKTELSKQSNKLQDNHSILLQLQGALQRIETRPTVTERRLSDGSPRSRTHSTPQPEQGRPSKSSAVCRVM